MSLFPILLVLHVTLALSLLLPSLVLPFLLRRGEDGTERLAGAGTRALMALQGTGSLWVAAGLAVTGGGLLTVLGLELLSRPWLLVALGLYGANLLVAAFVSRPNLRRLLHLGEGQDQATWRQRARRQRFVAYAMAAATGAIGLLMSAKPELW